MSHLIVSYIYIYIFEGSFSRATKCFTLSVLSEIGENQEYLVFYAGYTKASFLMAEFS